MVNIFLLGKKGIGKLSKVNVELGYKVNMGLGSFETYEIRVGIQDEPKPGENTEDAFNRVYDYVESKLETKVAAAKAEL